MIICRYDYRIKYFNLKETRSQNALALEDVNRMWIPFLVFDNTERNEATKVVGGKNIFRKVRICIFCFKGTEDKCCRHKNIFCNVRICKHFCLKGTEDTELTLTREGEFVGSEDDNVEEINIFDGQDNRITFEQVGDVENVREAVRIKTG